LQTILQWSSWSLPPKLLGLQVKATSARLYISTFCYTTWVRTQLFLL
jgi:hypothetical protein